MGISTKTIKSKLRDNALTLATLGGVICGIILGLCLRQRSEEYTAREAMYIQFIGKLYISLFRMHSEHPLEVGKSQFWVKMIYV